MYECERESEQERERERERARERERDRNENAVCYESEDTAFLQFLNICLGLWHSRIRRQTALSSLLRHGWRIAKMTRIYNCIPSFLKWNFFYITPRDINFRTILLNRCASWTWNRETDRERERESVWEREGEGERERERESLIVMESLIIYLKTIFN